MLKTLSVFTVITAVSVGIVGCSSKVDSVAQAPKEIQNEFSNAPKWVLTQDNGKGMTSAGSAKVGKSGMQFAITEAEAIARDGMARKIEVKVSNMLKSFNQQTGVGDAQTVDKVVSNVSKQISKQDLVGTERKDLWISPSGDVWVLMSMSEDSMNAVKNIIKSSYKNDDALHQQVLAKQAQDELDKELEKL